MTIMKRGTQKEMNARREEMLGISKSGMKPSEWIPLVAKDHEISEDAVKRDWGNRRNWIGQFMKIDDSQHLAVELLQDYEVAILDAYYLYEEAEDVKTKIQAMWLRLKIIKEKKEFLKEIRALDFMKADFQFQGYKHDREYDQQRMIASMF